MKTYNKKLYKSADNKMVTGAIGGLGEYFDVDPVLFRVVYVGFSVFTGVLPGVLTYIIMSMVIPKQPEVIHEKAL